MVDKARAQRTDAHPSSRRQLEVFGDATIEQKALEGVVRIRESQRVADPIEALLIEGSPRQFRLSPIARRDVWSAQSRFELAVMRHQFELHAAARQPDIAGRCEIPRASQGER